MMEYAQEFNSTTLATSTQSATMACIAMRVGDVSSIRKWVSDAPQTRPAGENPCAFSRPPSLHMVCARKSSLCPRTPWSYPCTRRIWPTLTADFSCINKISKKFAALATLTRRLADASQGLNPEIRVVCACPTWIAPLLIPLYLLIASAVTHPRVPNIAI